MKNNRTKCKTKEKKGQRKKKRERNKKIDVEGKEMINLKILQKAKS